SCQKSAKLGGRRGGDGRRLRRRLERPQPIANSLIGQRLTPVSFVFAWSTPSTCRVALEPRDWCLLCVELRQEFLCGQGGRLSFNRLRLRQIKGVAPLDMLHTSRKHSKVADRSDIWRQEGKHCSLCA